MGVLREAANQQELKFAQRRLAAMHRHAEKQELPKKVLAGVPQFLATEARLQEAWVAEKKASGEKAEDADPELIDAVDFQVECRACGTFFSWSALKAGDGCCTDCCSKSHARSSSQASTATPQCLPENDLLVACSRCGLEVFWSKLAEGDGVCASCAARPAEPSAASSQMGTCTEGVEDSAAPRWMRHSRTIG